MSNYLWMPDESFWELGFDLSPEQREEAEQMRHGPARHPDLSGFNEASREVFRAMVLECEALSTVELQAMWQARAWEDEDERVALRTVLRKRLGI